MNDILREIEYYESIGKHALADKLQRELVKLAKRFKIEDSGSGALSQALLLQNVLFQINDAIAKIPECARCFNAGLSDGPAVIGDLKDLAARQQGNQNDIDDFVANYHDMLNYIKHPPGNVQDDCDECYLKLQRITEGNPLFQTYKTQAPKPTKSPQMPQVTAPSATGRNSRGVPPIR